MVAWGRAGPNYLGQAPSLDFDCSQLGHYYDAHLYGDNFESCRGRTLLVASAERRVVAQDPYSVSDSGGNED